jgi:hypothetical protein
MPALVGAAQVDSGSMPRWIQGVSGFTLGDSSSQNTGQTVGPALTVTGITVKTQTAANSTNSWKFTLHQAGSTLASGDYASCIVQAGSAPNTCQVTGLSVNIPAATSINWHLEHTGSGSTLPGWVLLTIQYS